jgi:hypothetical protein
VCPCSKSVRWVVDESAAGNGHGHGTPADDEAHGVAGA